MTLFAYFCGKMRVVIFIVIFIARDSDCSVDRLLGEVKSVASGYEMDVAEDEDFARSVFYVIQTVKVQCVRVTGDRSLFHERLVAGLQPYIPPAVISDSNIYKCNVTVLAVEDAKGLWDTISNQPLRATDRFYCLVGNSTLESLYDMFKDHTKVFKDAQVAMFIVNHYKKGLKVAPPHNKLEEMLVPSEGYWEVQEATSAKTEIRFTTGNCDIHGTVNGNVSGLDPYTPGNFGGTDFVIFSKIAEIMQWDMKYVHTTKEQYLGEYNGTWKGGLLGSLVDNTADVAFCGTWIDWRKLSDGIQMSVPMAEVCVQYIVPRPVVAKSNKPIAKCFTAPVYALMIAMLVVTCFTVNFMNNADKYFVPSADIGYRSWNYCFLVVWGILLQGNYPVQSAALGSVRRIILLWVILSMLLTCSFSSQLVSNFSNPDYTKKPRNVQELVEFGYWAPYYGDEDVYPWSGIFNPDEPYPREWLSRAESVTDFDDFVERLRTWPKQAFIGTMYDKFIFTPGSVLPRPIPEEVIAGYETMDECVRTIYEAFAVRQGSRFYQKINKLLMYFNQYGILQKIYADAVEELAKKQPGLRNLTVRVTHGLKPLGWGHLSGVFRVLRLGMGFSLLVFVCEILVHRRRKKGGDKKTKEITSAEASFEQLDDDLRQHVTFRFLH